MVQPQNEGVSLSCSPPPMPCQPLPGQRLSGRDAGHDDALRSRRGHSFEGSSPELLKKLLLALLHAGHGPPPLSHGQTPPPPSSPQILSATSHPHPPLVPVPVLLRSREPNLPLPRLAGRCAVPSRPRLPFMCRRGGERGRARPPFPPRCRLPQQRQRPEPRGARSDPPRRGKLVGGGRCTPGAAILPRCCPGEEPGWSRLGLDPVFSR